MGSARVSTAIGPRWQVGRAQAPTPTSAGLPSLSGGSDVEAAAWAVESGRRHRGAAAINRALAELGGGWPVAARLYALPLLGRLQDAAYDWVANHRSLASRLWSDPPEEGHR